MSVILIILGVVGIIHAFLPFIFTKTVSNGIKRSSKGFLSRFKPFILIED